MAKRFKDFYSGKPVLPDAFYNDLPEEYRRLAFTVSNIQKVDLVAKVLKDVTEGLEKFETFDKWKETLTDDVYNSIGEAQLQTVYRTTMSTAYTNGIIEQSKATGLTTKYAFQAIIDSETRDNHLACDGVVLPADHPFWNAHTPPLGYNCRCTLIALNEENEVGDNPPESLQATRPDKGFGLQANRLESHLNSTFRKDLSKLPADMRVAALQGFAKKTEVVDDFLQENKNNFTKPGNDE